MAEDNPSSEQRLKEAESRVKTSLLIYTDGSASPLPAAGWGWIALDPMQASLPPLDQRTLAQQWGPVERAPDLPTYLGATRLTNNTGEISAIGQAMRWALTWDDLGTVEEIQIRTDSQWACRVLAQGKAKANKALVKTVRDIMQELRTRTTVHLIWIKGHQANKSATAFWNAQVDWLAGEGMRGRQSKGVLRDERPPCGGDGAPKTGQAEMPHGVNGDTDAAVPDTEDARVGVG